MKFEIKLCMDNAESEAVNFKKEIEEYEIEGIDKLEIKQTKSEDNSMGGEILTDVLAFAISSGAVGIIVSKVFEIGQRLFDGKRGEIELSHKCGDKEFSWKYPVTSKKDIEEIKAEFEEKIKKECGKNIILLK